LKKSKKIGVALPAILLLAAFWLTRPLVLSPSDLPEHRPDAAAGERIFWAGGCASCHATLVDGRRAKGGDKLLLGGGLELDTPFGVFRVPNISPHNDDGIGTWSMLEFVNAMQRGVAPDGRHYYPSFPYTSYARMRVEDVMDLKSYIDTLPAVEGRIEDHALSFPFTVRRGIGVWKRLYLDDQPVLDVDADDEALLLGRYLVEGAGHCSECHTPRSRMGGLDSRRWLAGAPNPDGDGQVPNITPGDEEFGEWSTRDIAYYLKSGFTPDFDTVGGSMVAVQENLALLSDSDREAIAAYLKAVPPVE
jgi:mono/diheme cytochrome c family protein